MAEATIFYHVSGEPLGGKESLEFWEILTLAEKLRPGCQAQIKAILGCSAGREYCQSVAVGVVGKGKD